MKPSPWTLMESSSTHWEVEDLVYITFFHQILEMFTVIAKIQVQPAKWDLVGTKHFSFHLGVDEWHEFLKIMLLETYPCVYNWTLI